MANRDTQYIHALRSIDGIDNGTITALLTHFENGEHAWSASADQIQAVPKISNERKELLIAKRKILRPDVLWEKLLALGITLHTKSDPTYPSLLREIPDSPMTLYTRGTFDWTIPAPFIALVGSRKHSSYGEQAATKLAEDLTHAGLVVVSGMAFGIDSHAHRGAIEAGGETIAVLGSGIDDRMISPASHFALAQNILNHGALVSEYPPGTGATPGSFPMRDRIIAGLCLGTIVIEAPEKSGSLITATCALDYNRQVFAVPGSIFSPYSIGTNTLIKKGAKMVMGVQDILEEFSEHPLMKSSQETQHTKQEHDLSQEEEQVLTFLTHEPRHIDTLIKETTLKTALLGATLSLLEMKGLAKNVGGMHYVRM